MKRFKNYAGVLLAILLCVTLSVVMALPVSADLVVGTASDFTVNEPDDDPFDIPPEEQTPSEDETDTPPEDETSSDGSYIEIEDPFGTTESTDTESTESDEDTESTESDAEGEGDESSNEESSYEEEPSYEENEDYGSTTYYPGNGEDITGNAGSGSDEWGADYSEGKVVSKSGSTAKKNIADYQGKMLGLIWIPIVLIVLAAGTLIVTNVYFSKKKHNSSKGTGTKHTHKK